MFVRVIIFSFRGYEELFNYYSGVFLSGRSRVGCTGGSSANIARAHLAEVIRKEAGLATSEYGEDGTG